MPLNHIAMDTSEPQSEPQLSHAQGGNHVTTQKSTTSKKSTNPKPLTTKSTEIGFVVTTPDQFRIDQLKTRSHHGQADALNPLKRYVDLAHGASCEPPAKKNKGGRPRIHPVKPKPKIRFFKKRTRISASMCADIWSRILDFSTPGFLLQARQTSRLLRVLLEKQSLWKAARWETYGFHHPDPPPGLDEMQYADLLSGTGCQTKGCGERSVRKVYWGFQRRWCPSCLRTNTMKESDTTDLFEAYPWLRECVPKATFDTWSRYCWVGEHPNRPSWAKSWGSHTRYSRFFMTKLIREFEDFLAVGSNEVEKTKEQRKAWVDERVEVNRILTEKIGCIEAFVEEERRKKAQRVQEIKQEREAFFKERALKMVPPLSPEALELLPKYRLATEIQKPPSERSWQELLPKLEADRTKAEERIRNDKELRRAAEFQRMSAENYDETVESRKDYKTAEQIFVLELADKVVAEMGALVAAGSLAPEDFIPFVFRKVYDTYKGEPDEAKPAAGDGKPYRLLMDDARMVYRVKILPFIATWTENTKRTVAIQLRCPGCRRKEGCRRHSFEDLIDHIFKHHTSKVGTLSYFRNTTCDPSIDAIAWCSLDWPPNLPLLAIHRVVTGEWDPNDDSKPIQAPYITKPIPRNAYEGRYVVRGNDPPRCDFVKNLVHAATLFQGTTLAGKFKTQVVFKYAVDRHVGSGSESFVPVKALKDLPVALLRANVRGIFERFRCRKCIDMNGRERCGKKFATHAHTVGELTTHYLESHEHSLWTKDMFHFPSGEELWDALTKPGMEQAYKVFGTLFPEEGESPSIITWGDITTADKVKPSSTPLNTRDTIAQLDARGLNTQNMSVLDSIGQDSDGQDLDGRDLKGLDLLAKAFAASDANATKSNAQTLNVDDVNSQDSNGEDLVERELNGLDLLAKALDAPYSSLSNSYAQDLETQGVNAPDPTLASSYGQDFDTQGMNAPDSNLPESQTHDLDTQNMNAPDSNLPDSYLPDSYTQNLGPADMNAQDWNLPDSCAQGLDTHGRNAPDFNLPHSYARNLDARDWGLPDSCTQGLNTHGMNAPDSNLPDSYARNLDTQNIDARDWSLPNSFIQGLGTQGMNAPDSTLLESCTQDLEIQNMNAQVPKGDGMNRQDCNAQDPNRTDLDVQDLDAQNVSASDLSRQDSTTMDLDDRDLKAQDSNVQDLNAQSLRAKDLSMKYLSTMGGNTPPAIKRQVLPPTDEESSQSRWKCVGWTPQSLWGNPPGDVIS